MPRRSVVLATVLGALILAPTADARSGYLHVKTAQAAMMAQGEKRTAAHGGTRTQILTCRRFHARFVRCWVRTWSPRIVPDLVIEPTPTRFDYDDITIYAKLGAGRRVTLRCGLFLEPCEGFV